MIYPRLRAFPIALLSALIVGAGTAFGLLLGRDLCRALAWREARVALDTTNLQALRNALKTVTRPTIPNIIRLSIGLKEEWQSALDPDLAIKLAELLNRNALQEVLTTLREGRGRETIASWASPQVVNNFLQALEEAEATQARIAVGRWERTVKLQQLDGIVKQQLLLKGDLADLLGVREGTKFGQLARGVELPDNIPTYKSGILEGLPALELIADGIPGIFELVAEATRYDGNLQSSSLDDINNKIEDLRRAFAATTAAYEEKRRTLDYDIDSINRELESLRTHLTKVRQGFTNVLIEAFQPPPPELAPLFLIALSKRNKHLAS